MKTRIFLILFLFIMGVDAAVPRDFVVDVKADVSPSSPHITLSWTQRVQSNISSQRIHRRLKGETSWSLQATLITSQTSWTDPTALPNVEYEYWMERRFTGLSPNVAVGYLSAGYEVPEIHSRGRLLLAIDDTMVAPLAPEISLLRADLAADGWSTRTIVIPRDGTAISTKALIKAAYDEDPTNTRALFLLSSIPVAYSGNIAPDGHGDHGGAWPADAYYGDMDGVWTDTTINTTSASSVRNRNIPGDGKFDQSILPGMVELEIGRVDLAEINRSPSSAISEISLLRRYLRRNHQFRHKLGEYADIPRGSIIRDGFGHLNNSEPFAVQGWATAFSSIGGTIDTPGNGQWFTPAFASGKNYLFGYGCGSGSHTSAGTVGSSLDFGTKASRVVFTSLFGSYHGDWASESNLMRSVIAGNAEGSSLGLTCLWSGRPNWFTHHIGMGETWGYAARTSMNAGLHGANSYLPAGSSSRSIHLGLMGDPTLRAHIVEPPRSFSATTSSGDVHLSWAASEDPDVTGYHLYRATSPEGPFELLTPSSLSGTSYTDATTIPEASYTYLVKTLKLEYVPGGSYHNLSIGSAVTITPSSSSVSAPANPSDLQARFAQPILLAGFHGFNSTAGSEAANSTATGFTGTLMKSTDSRSNGGSSNPFYGDSSIPTSSTSDGFVRMTGNTILSIAYSGTAPQPLDSFLFDATSTTANVSINLSCTINGGASVLLTASPILLPLSTASDTEIRPYGKYRLPLSGLTLESGDTIAFTVSLASGTGARLDNLSLAGIPPFTGTAIELVWNDNSSDETGFRVERQDTPTEPFTSIATLPPNTTTFTDTTATNHGGTYVYRIAATGMSDSTFSNEFRYEPLAGIVAFDETAAKYDKTTGFAEIPVTRSSGSHGAVTVNFTASNSSATSTTHYFPTSGTLSWADGEGGTKFVTVPFRPASSLPRQFKVTLSAPTGGLGLGMRYVHAALIEDPAATLESPWTFSTLGTIANFSPAISEEGAIGDAIIGGTRPVSGGASETGNFTHQIRSGDGSIVMRIRGANPSQASARYGVMVRSTLDTNSPMAVTLIAPSSAGTQFMYRSAAGGGITVPSGASWPGNSNNLTIPVWVRLTRLGNLFYSEASSNGTTWTYLASQSIPGISQTAYWGIYHCSDAIYSTMLGDFQLAAYESASVGPPVIPATPTAFAITGASSAGVVFAWNSQLLATSYQLERRGDDGSEATFTPSAAGTYTDATALPDTAYEYRISAVNSGGSSAPTPFIRAVTPAATAIPLRPGFLQSVPVASTGIDLSWFAPPAGGTGVEISRQPVNGEWSSLPTGAPGISSFSDTTVLPGVRYRYRVRNLSESAPSSWTTRFPIPDATPVIAPGEATGYRLWLLANNLPMDESGPGNATAAPGDGTPALLIKYALGLPAAANHLAGRISQAAVNLSGTSYPSFSYTRPDTAPADLTYTVEHSTELTPGSWTSEDILPAGSATADGFTTVTIRTNHAINSSGKRFFRLKILKN